MSMSSVARSARATVRTDSPAPPEVSGDHHRRAIGPMVEQDFAGAREAFPAVARCRVVERHDEIGPGGRREPPLDGIPGSQQVRQRHGTEVVSEGRAGPCGGGLERRDSRYNGDVDAVPGVAVLARQQLEHQRRHGVDAGVPRRDQGDAPPPGRQIEGGPRPRLLVAEREVVARLAAPERSQQIEVEAIAHPDRRRGRSRRRPRGCARRPIRDRCRPRPNRRGRAPPRSAR